MIGLFVFVCFGRTFLFFVGIISLNLKSSKVTKKEIYELKPSLFIENTNGGDIKYVQTLKRRFISYINPRNSVACRFTTMEI